jgi:hypothetical protein
MTGFDHRLSSVFGLFRGELNPDPNPPPARRGNLQGRTMRESAEGNAVAPAWDQVNITSLWPDHVGITASDIIV